MSLIRGNPHSIPASMRNEDRWCLWRIEYSSDGKPTKVPYQARKGAHVKAKSNDPTTWTTFNDCLSQIKHFYPDFGIAFMLGDGWAGLDLDHVLDENRNYINDTAEEVMSEIEGIGYAEYSPSGRGIRVVWKDVDAPESSKYRKQVSIGEGKQGMEMYFHGRFFTITADNEKFAHWDIGHHSDCAVEYIGENFLINEKATPKMGTATVSDGLTRMLDGFVATVLAKERKEEGGRDNWLFRTGANIADRCGRSEAVVLEKLTLINKVCCIPPLPDEDVQRVARSACMNSETRYIEPKEYVPQFEIYEDEELMSASHDAAFAELKASNERFDYSKFYEDTGYIGAFMRQCRDESRRVATKLDFASAIASFSAIISGRAKIEDKHGGTYPNLFVTCTANSGQGKDYGRQLCKAVLEAAGFGKKVGSDDISSGQGFAALLVDNPTGLFCLDEFADSLGDNSKNSPIVAGISKTIKMSYSAGGGTYRPNARSDKSLNITIENCAPSIYMTTTSERFWSSFNDDMGADGFLGRLMYFGERDRLKLKEKGSKGRSSMYRRGSAPSDELVGHAKRWHLGRTDVEEFMGVKPLEFKVDDDAFNLFDELVEKVENRARVSHDKTTVLWDRCWDKVAKLSLIFAANGWREGMEPRIEKKHIAMAWQVVRASIYECGRHYLEEHVDTRESKLGKKILKILKREKKAIPAGGFASKGVRVAKREFNEAMEILVSAKEVAIVPNKRKNGDAYIAIEYYADWKEENQQEEE
jgi:hypothetical protein